MSKKRPFDVMQTESCLLEWDKNTASVIFITENFKTVSSETLCSKFETFTGLRKVVLRTYYGEENISDVLAVLKQVEILNIENSHIGGPRIEKFAHSLVCMTSLKCLSMMNMDLRDEQVVCISRALENMPNIVSVNLAYNKISDKGAIALAESLKSLCRLESLDLSYNNIGNEGTLAITESIIPLSNLREIFISSNSYTHSAAGSIVFNILECCSANKLNVSLNNLIHAKVFYVLRKRFIKLAVLTQKWSIKKVPSLLICNKVMRASINIFH
jgi:hypothetical protein